MPIPFFFFKRSTTTPKVPPTTPPTILPTVSRAPGGILGMYLAVYTPIVASMLAPAANLFIHVGDSSVKSPTAIDDNGLTSNSQESGLAGEDTDSEQFRSELVFPTVVPMSVMGMGVDLAH